MVVFNYTGRELSGKIVYYGPALSGKTTNLEQIYGQTPADTRGKMVSMKTKAERTLFFDLLPISRGQIGDFKVRFLLYTVPGQVYYNATRKLVLKGADAIVFVADSQRSQLAANIDSLRNLRTNLLEYGMCLDDLPWVIGYNKRDMPDAMSIEELEKELNPYGVPSFEQIAVTGEGVFEGFEKVSAMLMKRLEAQLRGDTAKPTVKAATPAAFGAPTAGIDAGALNQVKEAIQSTGSGVHAPIPARPAPAAPRPAAPPVTAASSDSLVIQRGFDGVQTGAAARSAPSGVKSPAAAPAPAAPAPATPAPAPAAVAPGAAAAPIVIERSLVIPVSAGDLAKGARKIRLVLDLDLRPEA